MVVLVFFDFCRSVQARHFQSVSNAIGCVSIIFTVDTKGA
jgi:hypothetical protein